VSWAVRYHARGLLSITEIQKPESKTAPDGAV
jgi:hypothetical protein